MTDKTAKPRRPAEILGSDELTAVRGGTKKHPATISHEPITLETTALGRGTGRFLDHDLGLND